MAVHISGYRMYRRMEMLENMQKSNMFRMKKAIETSCIHSVL